MTLLGIEGDLHTLLSSDLDWEKPTLENGWIAFMSLVALNKQALIVNFNWKSRVVAIVVKWFCESFLYFYFSLAGKNCSWHYRVLCIFEALHNH